MNWAFALPLWHCGMIPRRIDDPVLEELEKLAGSTGN